MVSQKLPAICVVVASDGEHALTSNYAKEIKRVSLPGGEVVAQSSTVMLNEPCLLFKLGDRVLALGKKRMAVIDDEMLEVVASRELETPVYHPRATSPVGDAFVSGKGAVWEIHRLSEEGELYSLGVQPLPWASMATINSLWGGAMVSTRRLLEFLSMTSRARSHRSDSRAVRRATSAATSGRSFATQSKSCWSSE